MVVLGELLWLIFRSLALDLLHDLIYRRVTDLPIYPAVPPHVKIEPVNRTDISLQKIKTSLHNRERERKKERMQPNQRSSGSQSPRSPQSLPFLSVSVTDPVKLGNGVQAYISYRVITKVIFSLDASVVFSFTQIRVC